MDAVRGRDEKFRKPKAALAGKKERTKLASKIIICHMQDPWPSRDVLQQCLLLLQHVRVFHCTAR